MGNGQEIIALAVEGTRPNEVRIALGARDMTLQNWIFDVQQGEARVIFSISLDKTIPKTISFAKNRTKDIYVFGLYDGRLCVVMSLSD